MVDYIQIMGTREVAIHPREGTETSGIWGLCSRYGSCNSSPRGDGNHGFAPRVPVLIRCNSSPRGDGNYLAMHAYVMCRGSLQFIPARGRKPPIWWAYPLPPRCNSSPRGDGNVFHRVTSIRPSVAIHPREGTETGKAEKIALVTMVAIHPREGTETVLLRFLLRSSRKVAIHPREGTETTSRHGFPEHPPRCNSSPRGDGNS